MTGDDADGRMAVPDAGDVITHERTFTPREVREFGQLTGDQQPIHTNPDEDGRLVVQGLLTGSLLTKIGGDLRVLARTIEFEFLKPVYTGEQITCEWRVQSKTEQEDRYLLENDIVCRDESGDEALEARTSGLIWKSDEQ